MDKLVSVEARCFMGVNMRAILQTPVISLLLAKSVLPALGFEALREEIAHAGGIVVLASANYLEHRCLSFSPQLE